MIKVKKNELKIKVSEDEKNQEALLIAELGVALIGVSKHLGKSKEEILNTLNKSILFFSSVEEAIKDFKECMEGNNG